METHEDRVTNISGTGTGPRLNGDFFLKYGESVFNDFSKDVLKGGAGQDWLFADPGDAVKGKKKGKK